MGTNGKPSGLGGRAPALPPWASAQLQGPIRLRLTDYAPPPLRIKENHAIKVGLIRQPTFIWRGYISRPLGPRRRHPLIPIHYSWTEQNLGFGDESSPLFSKLE